MRTYIKYICAALLFAAAPGYAALASPSLAKPNNTDVLRKTGSLAVQLKALLDEKKPGEFYIKADETLDLINKWCDEKETVNEEEQYNVMWVYYMIVNTPLLKLETIDDYRDEAVVSRKDIAVKEKLIGMLQHPVFDIFFPGGAKSGSKYNDMRASYASTVMSELRTALAASPLAAADPARTAKDINNKSRKDYLAGLARVNKKNQPSMPEVIPAKEVRAIHNNPKDSKGAARLEENNRTHLAWLDEVRNAHQKEREENTIRRNMALSQARRQQALPGALKRIESKYVSMLVRFYPGKAAQVKKYMRQAGYTDQEILDLLDRTLGRTGRTEFLYKGSKRGL